MISLSVICGGRLRRRTPPAGNLPTPPRFMGRWRRRIVTVTVDDHRDCLSLFAETKMEVMPAAASACPHPPGAVRSASVAR